jgi:hypothetical protein
MTAGELRALTTEVWANCRIEFWLGDPREGGVRLVPVKRVKTVKTRDGKPTAPPAMQIVFRPTDAPPPPQPVAQSLPTAPPEDHADVDHVPGTEIESDVLLAVP